MKILILILCLLPVMAQAEDYTLIDSINERVNGIRYITDLKNYGVEQYYATTTEFYENGGDCEDFAAAKDEELVAADIPRKISAMYGHLSGRKCILCLKLETMF